LNVKWPQLLEEPHFKEDYNKAGICKRNNKRKTCRKMSKKIVGEINRTGNYSGSNESNKSTRIIGFIVQQKDRRTERNGGYLRNQNVPG
jgi:hypothetical protein